MNSTLLFYCTLVTTHQSELPKEGPLTCLLHASCYKFLPVRVCVGLISSHTSSCYPGVTVDPLLANMTGCHSFFLLSVPFSGLVKTVFKSAAVVLLALSPIILFQMSTRSQTNG